MKIKAIIIAVLLALATAGCGTTQTEQQYNEDARSLGAAPKACAEGKPVKCEEQKAEAERKNKDEQIAKERIIGERAAQEVQAKREGH